jgi:hypothetical protein
MDDEDVIELKLEESNDLSFKLVVQGASSKPSSFRLVCEADEMSYCFAGKPDDEGGISFTIPPMSKMFKAESTYNCSVEVVVEGRVFKPVEFPAKFTVPMKVVSEGIVVKKSKEAPVSVVAQTKVSVVSKPTPVQVTVETVEPVRETLKDRFEKRKSGTGIDDSVMEEVVKRLSAKGSGNKSGR